MILPLRVFGRFSRKSISLGATAGPSRLRAWPSSSLRKASLGSNAGLQRDEGLDDFSGSRVRNADHAGLGDGGVLHQRAFDLERADQMAGALDHVVRPADEPVIAVGVAHREVAGEVPAADEAFAIALLLVEIAAHHRRPARPQRKLTHAHRRRDLAESAVSHARRWRPRCPAVAGPSSQA